MSMFNSKSKKEEVVVVQQPVAVQTKNDNRQLEKLFNELGSLKWVAPQGERGWNECVEQVRRRIIEMVRE